VSMTVDKSRHHQRPATHKLTRHHHFSSLKVHDVLFIVFYWANKIDWL